MKRIGILAEDLAGGCLVTVDYSKKAGFPRIAKCIYSVKPCHDELTDFERSLSIFYILAQSPSWFSGTLVFVLKIEDILKTAFEKAAELSR